MSETKTDSSGGVSIASLLIGFVKALLVSYVISLIIILGLSALVVYTDVPESVGDYGVEFVTYFGAFLSALIVARRVRKRGWFCGAVTGGANVCILLLIGMIFVGGEGFSPDGLMSVGGGCLSGVVGGVLGINSVKKSQ